MALSPHRAFLRAAIFLALPLGLLASPVGIQEAGAQDEAAKAFDPAEEEAIRELVRDYLLDNPEVIMEAVQIYRQRQQAEEEERARQNLVSQREELEQDPDAPVIGNPDGDVVIVEFFDYRCPYCTRVAEDLRQAVAEDGNIRLVMKEFPILGPDSVVAARMALAAVKQDKYEELHFALMTAGGQLDETLAFSIASHIGLDMEQLRRDMEAPEINEMLERNFALAQALQINGTPAFVIGEEIVRGAIDRQGLQRIVGQTRANAS